MRNTMRSDPRGEQHRQTVTQEAKDLLAECDAFEVEMASECIGRRNEHRSAKQ